MQFYKVQGYLQDEAVIEENNDRRTARRNAHKLMVKCEDFNRRLNGKGFYSVVRVEDDTVTICALTKKGELFDNKIVEFIACTGFPIVDFTKEEVTFSEFQNMLSYASREDYIEDDDDVLEKFGLDRLNGRWGRNMDFGENLIESLPKEEIVNRCSQYLACGTMLPEIERIYQGKGKSKASGHPVQYILETDDVDIRRELYQSLLSALYESGRIKNRRYCYINFGPGADFSRVVYDALYKSCEGGTMVVRFSPTSESEEDDFASTDRDVIHTIGEKIFNYRNRVLTILCLPRECKKIKESLFEEMGDLCCIELNEDLAKGDAAKQYLKMLAKENEIRPDKKLYEFVEEGCGYLSNDLRKIFDSWYDIKLRTNIYPQYKEAKKVKKELQKASPKGTAYERLNEMIGLSAAKEVIGNALDFYKAQKLYKEMGMKEDHPSMHLVFTGNPGTAKTTVARLFAEIMKDNGILSKGQMVECGRSDLVGKYVGWTAVQVKNKFKEAIGGVLFIDEAYSLCDDRSGSFGDEAINTIVQEMENHREDVVCIFAGYPDKMEGFLDKNPGLRSRIAFHVPFDDYSSEELCDITKLIAKQKGLTFEADALEKLSGIYENIKNEPDFGNGRAARNIVEKARMAQASRLVKIDFDHVTKDDIVTIKAEDIVAPATKAKETRRIGFCA